MSKNSSNDSGGCAAFFFASILLFFIFWSVDKLAVGFGDVDRRLQVIEQKAGVPTPAPHKEMYPFNLPWK